MDALELVLVSREQQGDGQATADYRIEVTLGEARTCWPPAGTGRGAR